MLLFTVTFLGGCSAEYLPFKSVDITVSVIPKNTDAKPVPDEEILKKAESARLINPWGETQSLSVVSEWVRFDFTPPAEEIILDNGRRITLTTYRYMTGTAEALYKTDNCELTFRQSRDLQGIALSGDYNKYQSEWDESINDLNVCCLGNNDLIHAAYYDTAEGHFSITYQSDGADDGLTAADLSMIIGSIR